ncbi:MAG: hypothetical protein MHM6MM_009615, partial [Cercozoa sp. M6MM]
MRSVTHTPTHTCTHTHAPTRTHTCTHTHTHMHMQQGRTKTSSSHVITALNKQRSDGDFDSETGVHMSSSMQPSAWMDRDGMNEYLPQLKIALGTPPTGDTHWQLLLDNFSGHYIDSIASASSHTRRSFAFDLLLQTRRAQEDDQRRYARNHGCQRSRGAKEHSADAVADHQCTAHT